MSDIDTAYDDWTAQNYLRLSQVENRYVAIEDAFRAGAQWGAEAMREAAAKVCERLSICITPWPRDKGETVAEVRESCALAIRALPTKEQPT